MALVVVDVGQISRTRARQKIGSIWLCEMPRLRKCPDWQVFRSVPSGLHNGSLPEDSLIPRQGPCPVLHGITLHKLPLGSFCCALYLLIIAASSLEALLLLEKLLL